MQPKRDRSSAHRAVARSPNHTQPAQSERRVQPYDATWGGGFTELEEFFRAEARNTHVTWRVALRGERYKGMAPESILRFWERHFLVGEHAPERMLGDPLFIDRFILALHDAMRTADVAWRRRLEQCEQRVLGVAQRTSSMRIATLLAFSRDMLHPNPWDERTS